MPPKRLRTDSVGAAAPTNIDDPLATTISSASSSSHRQDATSRSVFVRNLPYTMSDVDLSTAFETIGPVKRAFIVKSKPHTAANTAAAGTADSRGFGFVEFATSLDREAAVEQLNGSVIAGRTVKVERAVAKAQQQKKKVPHVKGASNDSQQTASKDEDDDDDEINQVQQRAEHQKEGKVKIEPTRADKLADKKPAVSDTAEQQLASAASRKRKREPTTSSISKSIPQPPAAAPSSSSSDHDCTLLISNLPVTLPPHSFQQFLTHHHITPLSIIYPSPESTLKYRAARLLFASQTQAHHAETILTSSPYPNSPLTLLNIRLTILTDKSSRLIIRNLPFHTLSKHILQSFQKFGIISNMTLPTHPQTGKMKGFAFIQYESVTAAQNALTAMNGTKFMGRTIAVDWSLSKDDYTKRQSMAQKVQEQSSQTSKTNNDDIHAIKGETSTNGTIGTAIDNKAIQAQSDDDDDSDSDEDDISVKQEDNIVKGENDSDHEDVEEEEDDEDDDDDDDNADDDNNEDDNNDADQNESDKKNLLETPEAKFDADEGLTLFLRNLSYDTTEEQLKTKFQHFGPIRYVKIVQEIYETTSGTQQKRSKGVAFIKFVHRHSVDTVLRLAEISSNNNNNITQSKKHIINKSSILQGSDELVVNGRALSVVLAVNKNIAITLDKNKQNDLKHNNKQDKRNLYLAEEGLILPNTTAAIGLTSLEIDRRLRYYREKKKKLEKNPNLIISKVRLSILNLPLDCTEKLLKKIFLYYTRKAVQKYENNKKIYGKDRSIVKIKQIKIIRDNTRINSDGLGRSKRFGFIEFTEHLHALLALRALNNKKISWNDQAFMSNYDKQQQDDGADNSNSNGGGNDDNNQNDPTVKSVSTSRLIVEFAVDDVRKVKIRDDKSKRFAKMKEMKSQLLQQNANTQTPANEAASKKKLSLSKSAVSSEPSDLTSAHKDDSNGAAADKTKTKNKKSQKKKRKLNDVTTNNADTTNTSNGQRASASESAPNRKELTGARRDVTSRERGPLPVPVIDEEIDSVLRGSAPETLRERKQKKRQREKADDNDFDQHVQAYKRQFFAETADTHQHKMPIIANAFTTRQS